MFKANLFQHQKLCSCASVVCFRCNIDVYVRWISFGFSASLVAAVIGLFLDCSCADPGR